MTTLAQLTALILALAALAVPALVVWAVLLWFAATQPLDDAGEGDGEGRGGFIHYGDEL